MNNHEIAYIHKDSALIQNLIRISLVFIVVGLVSAFILFRSSPLRFWQNYMLNTLFWLGLAHGGIVLSAVVRGVYGTWGRSTLRIAETTAVFIPVGILLFIGIFFGKHYLFYWASGVENHHPRVWMNFRFFVIRQMIPVLILSVLSLYYLYLSVREDMGKLGIRNSRIYGMDWLKSWGGEAEITEIQKKLVNIGITTIIAFTLTWSFIGFDMVMAMDKIWYSTMFGGYFFWDAFLSGIAFSIIVMLTVRKVFGLQKVFHEHVLHDYGKMLFAFSIFWMNLLWAQWLTIWYGNMPEETEFLFKRIVGVWKPYGWTTVILIFVIPFIVLMRKKPKVTPWVLGGVSFLVLVGLWLAKFLEIVPTLWHDNYVPLGILEFGIAIGFLGLFMLVYFNALTKFPLIPVGDPKLEESLHPPHH